jgi:hypothetical protein
MRSENNRLLQDDPGFLQEITSIAVEVGLAIVKMVARVVFFFLA